MKQPVIDAEKPGADKPYPQGHVVFSHHIPQGEPSPQQLLEEKLVPLLKLGEGVVIQVAQGKGIKEGVEPQHRHDKDNPGEHGGADGKGEPKEDHNSYTPLHQAQVHLPGAGPKGAQEAEQSTLSHGESLLSNQWPAAGP